MVAKIFEVISQVIVGATGALASATEGVVGIFWNSTANEGAGALTFAGTMLLMAAGVGVSLLAFRFIRNLVRVRIAK